MPENEPKENRDPLESKLKDLGIDLDKVRTWINKAEDEVRAEYQEHMPVLRDKFDEFQRRFQELIRDESVKAEVRQGLNNAWTDVKGAFNAISREWGKAKDQDPSK